VYVTYLGVWVSNFKKKHMNLTNQQKAALYVEGIRRYNLVEEEIRQIKAKNFEVSDSDRQIIERLERKKKEIFNRTQTLHAK